MSLSASWRFNRTCKLPIAVALNLLLVCTAGLLYRSFTQVISPEAIGWFATLLLFNIFCFFRVLDIGFQMAWLPKLAISLFWLVFTSIGIQVTLLTPVSQIHLDPDTVRASCLAVISLLLLLEGSALVGEFLWRHLPFERQTAFIQKVSQPVLARLHLRIIALTGIALSIILALASLSALLLPLAYSEPSDTLLSLLYQAAPVLIMSIVIVLLDEPDKGRLEKTGIYAGILILLLNAQILLLLGILAAWAMKATNLFKEPGLCQWIALAVISLFFVYLSTVQAAVLASAMIFSNPGTQGLLISMAVTGLILGLMGAVLPYCQANSLGRHLIHHAGFWGVGILIGTGLIKMLFLSLVLLLVWGIMIKAGYFLVYQKKQGIWHIPADAKPEAES